MSGLGTTGPSLLLTDNVGLSASFNQDPPGKISTFKSEAMVHDKRWCPLQVGRVPASHEIVHVSWGLVHSVCSDVVAVSERCEKEAES